MATGRTEASGPSPKLASNREQTVWGVVLFDQAIPRKVPFHRHEQEGKGHGERAQDTGRADKRPFLIYSLVEVLPESANIWNRMELVAISGLQMHFITTS